MAAFPLDKENTETPWDPPNIPKPKPRLPMSNVHSTLVKPMSNENMYGSYLLELICIHAHVNVHAN